MLYIVCLHVCLHHCMYVCYMFIKYQSINQLQPVESVHRLVVVSTTWLGSQYQKTRDSLAEVILSHF